MMHDFKVQGRNKISTTQRTAGVTASGPMYHSNNIPSDLRSNFCKCWHKILVLINLQKQSVFSKMDAKMRSFLLRKICFYIITFVDVQDSLQKPQMKTIFNV